MKDEGKKEDGVTGRHGDPETHRHRVTLSPRLRVSPLTTAAILHRSTV